MNCNELDKRTKAYKECIENQSKGLGDIVEDITEATGIKKVVKAIAGDKDCGCDKRKEALNKYSKAFLSMFSTRKKPKRCLTDEMYLEYSTFFKTRTLKYTTDQIKMLLRIYEHVFAISYNQKDFCANCQGSVKTLIAITEALDKVYNNYKTENNENN